MATTVVDVTPALGGDSGTSPATTAVGDLMFAHLMVEQPAGAVTPTYDDNGFALRHLAYADTVDGAQKLYHIVLSKVSAGAGPQVFDFNVSPSAGCHVGMGVVRNQHASAYIGDTATGQIDNASTNTLALSALDDTPAFGYACLLFVITDHDLVGNVTATGPAGYTERYDSGGMMLYTLVDIPVGPVASPTVTLSSNASADAYAVLIRPGPAEGEAGFRDYCGSVES